jgi:hypothetical protein
MSGPRSSRAKPRESPKRNRGQGYVGYTRHGHYGPGWPTLADGTQANVDIDTSVLLEGIEGLMLGRTVRWTEDQGWLVTCRFPGTEPLVECHVNRLALKVPQAAEG